MEEFPGRTMLRALAALALFSAAGLCLAQGAWISNGPEGGSVYCLVQDPFVPTTVYAGTRQGVVRSTDSGASWGLPGAGMPSVKVTTIAADSTTPGTLYAGTMTASGVQSLGIFKSTDSGATWTPINNGLVDTGTGISPVDVLVLAIDPNSPITILAGTNDSDIFKSTDGGATWHAKTTGGSDFGFAVTAYQFLPGNASTVFAASDEGLLQSTDGGETWVFFGNEADSLSALLIDPKTPTTMYAGSADGAGVLKSTNGGNSFSAINKNLPVNQDAAGSYSPLVLAMMFDPASSSTLYLGTYGNGLFKSTDATSWSVADTGMRNLYASALGTVGGSSPALLAGALEGGVYASTDGAATWVFSSSGLEQSTIYAFAVDGGAPGTAYAATFDRVQKTLDEAVAWQDADSGIPLFTVTSLALVPGNPATLFAATGGGGLLTSTDGGGSWAVVDKSLADTYVSSVIVDPTNSSTLYAGTDHPYDGTHSERLYKSTNGGVTWLQTSLDAQGNSVDIIAVHPVNPSTVYAASHGTGGLFQSLDGGTTWTTLTTDSACGGVNAILFNASGSTMYLAGTTGVCRSTDGAQTWTLSPVANLASVQALCFDPLDPSILYAGALPLTATGTGGVFASFDGGMTWSAFGSGLPASIAVTTLAVDGKTGTLYAGTQGSGVATLLLLASRPRIDAPAQTHKTLTLPQR